MSGREPSIGPRAAVEQAFRDGSGKIVAILMGEFRDLELVEDAVQDALTEALRSWPARGRPDNTTAWIIATARNRAIDRLRRQTVGARKLEQLQPLEARLDAFEELVLDEDIPDERLRLIFTSCHPALDRKDAVALTLWVIAGMSARDVAAAFLVKETTMQARLTRAKAKIRQAAIPYRVPDHHELPDRLAAVLDVISLIYNQGYRPAPDPAVGRSLRAEALAMAAMVGDHLPDEPEALGLHALLLFHETRAPGRFDGSGNLVGLEDQDRSGWHHHLSVEGDRVLERALRLGRPGPYQLQAAISAVHSTSPGPGETDWAQIALLYDRLLELAPSPTTAIGRAVAIGMARGPSAGLDSLPPPDPPLDTFHRWHAARGDLLRRDGDSAGAAEALGRAAELATNPAERRWLRAQQQRCLS